VQKRKGSVGFGKFVQLFVGQAERAVDEGDYEVIEDLDAALVLPARYKFLDRANKRISLVGSKFKGKPRTSKQ
jgi:hypothetical protein